MKHVFKTVVKLVKSIASKGYANAMAEADEASRRDLKLHGIYNNQTGSGRRSFFRMKIGLPRLWFGSGDQYLRPEYRERARRRGERYFRHRPFTMDAPSHIQEKVRL